MRESFRWAVVAIAATVLIISQPVSAQAPAQTKQNWQCKVNIAVPGINIPANLPETVFYTTKTRKQCPGNTSTSGGTANITITCETEGPIPGWTGGAQNARNFPCTIYREPCGLGGLVRTSDTSMQINAGGIASLRCTCDNPLNSSTCAFASQ